MKKVLIVEDDNFLANAYRVKLSKSGFEIKIARDGEDALATLQTFVPDAMVLDLVMPKKDGFATLQEMMANPNLRQIPVIVASNLSQKEDIDRAMKLGARDYFIKSDLSLNDLIAKIKKLLPTS